MQNSNESAVTPDEQSRGTYQRVDAPGAAKVAAVETQAHTKEPWTVDRADFSDATVFKIDADSAPWRIASIEQANGAGSGRAVAKALANFERIVACVNALVGVKDPAAFVAAAKARAASPAVETGIDPDVFTYDAPTSGTPWSQCISGFGRNAVEAIADDIGRYMHAGGELTEARERLAWHIGELVRWCQHFNAKSQRQAVALAEISAENEKLAALSEGILAALEPEGRA